MEVFFVSFLKKWLFLFLTSSFLALCSGCYFNISTLCDFSVFCTPWGRVGDCDYATQREMKRCPLVAERGVWHVCRVSVVGVLLDPVTLWLSWKKQVLGELFPQTSSQLCLHTEGRSPVWFGWGTPCSRTPPSPRPCHCLSSDRSVWAKASSASLQVALGGDRESQS